MSLVGKVPEPDDQKLGVEEIASNQAKSHEQIAKIVKTLPLHHGSSSLQWETNRASAPLGAFCSMAWSRPFILENVTISAYHLESNQVISHP
jgi:hypothetical protein